MAATWHTVTAGGKETMCVCLQHDGLLLDRWFAKDQSHRAEVQMSAELQPYCTNENPKATSPGRLPLLLLHQAPKMLLMQYTSNYKFMFQEMAPLENTLNWPSDHKPMSSPSLLVMKLTLKSLFNLTLHLWFYSFFFSGQWDSREESEKGEEEVSVK